MKTLYILTWIYLFIEQYSGFNIPIFSNKIFSYPISIWLQYFICFGLILFGPAVYFLKKKIPLCFYFVYIFIFLTIVIAFTNFLSFNTTIAYIITDGVIFFFPFSLYIFSELFNIKLIHYEIILCLCCWIGAVLSVLIALGTLDMNLWAESGELYRTAGNINSSLGTAGYIYGLAKLNLKSEELSEKEKKTIVWYSVVISSLIIVCLSQSRSRMVIIALISVIIVIHKISTDHNMINWIKFLIGLIFTIAIIQLFLPQIYQFVFMKMTERFHDLNDANVTYRQLESSLQINEYMKNWLIGTGLGSRMQYTIEKNTMYYHNMYSSMLMFFGTIGGLYYNSFFIWFGLKTYKLRKKGYDMLGAEIVLWFTLAIAILNITSAGITQSGSHLMILYIFLYHNSYKRTIVKST